MLYTLSRVVVRGEYTIAKTHLKCVHAIICKLFLNKADEKKKAKQKPKDTTMDFYHSVKQCQITTYFPSYSKVMYCIPILG